MPFQRWPLSDGLVEYFSLLQLTGT